MICYQKWITAGVTLSTVAILTGCTTASTRNPTSNDASNQTLVQNTTPASTNPTTASGRPTIGGIALGDTAAQVRKSFHKPNQISNVYGQPYIEWDYNNGLTVIFHSKNKTSNQPEGVWKIDVAGKSKLKTNTNIGYGESKNLILTTYRNAEIKTEKLGKNHQTIRISTQNYLLVFEVQNNKIEEIMLQQN